ncbi:MAG: hypothetical protein NC548_63175 [Lachnospiraceae bacterium]|nr:hypothetical protein [Lachnospiraceae bacterium]
MTDLERQAKEYAKAVLADYPSVFGMLKRDICPLIAKSYTQGWVDRGRKDFNSEIAKRSDLAPDCEWFDCGDCRKGLPDTPCELSKCVAYMPKSEKK